MPTHWRARRCSTLALLPPAMWCRSPRRRGEAITVTPIGVPSGSWTRVATVKGCRSCENALAVCDRSAKDSDAMEGLSGDRASGPDRRHQGADTQDGNDAFEVVGQDVEAHLRADPLQRAGQEVRRAHPGLDGAKRVLHGLPPD